MKFQKSLKTKTLIFFSLILPGVFLSNSIETSILRNSKKEVIDHVWQIIYRDFLDSEGVFVRSDWVDLRKEYLSRDYSNDKEAYDAIRTMLATLNDPYTRFLDPDEFYEMRIDTSGELTGIGIQIIKDTETDQLKIVSPIEGTPASLAGLQSNDIIISIDDISTTGMNIDEAVGLIRGVSGTEVELGIMRDGNIFYRSLVRERIEIKSVISKINVTKEGFLIGYIRIKQFNANASNEISDILLEMEGEEVSGYILDLRSNPGGLLDSSIEISRLFINSGIIVSTLTRDGLREVTRANNTALTTKPLIVLVNEGSASASEILSGAIKDNERGLLVGKTTFGKGLVQSMRTLIDGSGLTVTVAKYLTPNGTDINKSGIEPDIDVSMNVIILNEEIGTSRDRQYRVGEKELIKIIKLQSENDLTSFNPSSTNPEVALSINNDLSVYVL